LLEALLAHDLLENTQAMCFYEATMPTWLGRKDSTMTNAVSYAYTNNAEERPTLLDQFTACRNYAAAHGYEIAGEFNDIDEGDHQATGAGQEAIREAVARDRATLVLVYQPSPSMLDRLSALGGKVETVTTPRAEQVNATHRAT
jgi:hypothetical protein